MNTPELVEKRAGCIAHTVKVLGDKWTALLLRELASGPKRFTGLEHSLKGISPRTLSQRLDSLCEMEVVEKQIYCKQPPRAEYMLTKKGTDLIPILQEMADWGAKYE
jgi:DNA-binding HxlR family transcriptional regulator